jgi:hypothetical protein
MGMISARHIGAPLNEIVAKVEKLLFDKLIIFLKGFFLQNLQRKYYYPIKVINSLDT